jgi:hypothetical protein
MLGVLGRFFNGRPWIQDGASNNQGKIGAPCFYPKNTLKYIFWSKKYILN